MAMARPTMSPETTSTSLSFFGREMVGAMLADVICDGPFCMMESSLSVQRFKLFDWLSAYRFWSRLLSRATSLPAVWSMHRRLDTSATRLPIRSTVGLHGKPKKIQGFRKERGEYNYERK